MSKTIDLLFDNIFEDDLQHMHPAVKCDYFGLNKGEHITPTEKKNETILL